ncbi:thioesterase-like superfamily-domain-containing protein [Lasiosphaeria miniovina]|uniref:Thioesterase-like superfamily-domain-containing protein n=1 Tax=Lasiosphaeria miniovina TaxID=1954250 RepID=A0AA40B721_9PEZI|nr:thioesterase-like superfamily-domain-containing protein [Lasiosphaeria miniovina]KAK0728861.1 thioesterase-like superfamily-domain-containing protein [Lasiosphaeria miniovina]
MAQPTSLTPFSLASRVERLDSHTYKANLVDGYCIGTVPNGGYVASCLVRAASIHLAARGQTDTLTAHFEFLNRTEVGPAIIVVDDVKPGRQLSTVHVTLYQHALLPQYPWITPGTTRKEIAAYMTMADLQKEQGISLPTGWTLSQPSAPPPTPDFAALRRGHDAHWEPLVFLPGNVLAYTRCLQNCAYYAPRGGQPSKSTIDLWVRLASGEPFTNASLAYVADCWPYVVEAYRPSKEDAAAAAAAANSPLPFPQDSVFWYPTVVLNLDQKKTLPAKGLDWLRLRVQTKQIRNGRLDLEVVVMDADGELVALSQHVALILDSARNTGERKTKTGKASGSHM